jgi:hypothetical protein
MIASGSVSGVLLDHPVIRLLADYQQKRRARWARKKEEESDEERTARQWLEAQLTIALLPALTALNQSHMLAHDLSIVDFDCTKDDTVVVYLGLPFSRNTGAYLPDEDNDLDLERDRVQRLMLPHVPWASTLHTQFAAHRVHSKTPYIRLTA